MPVIFFFDLASHFDLIFFQKDTYVNAKVFLCRLLVNELLGVRSAFGLGETRR
jgi:hypothetical protein